MSDRRERMIALREGICATAEDAYFDARKELDTKEARRLFRAAFERGYEQASDTARFQLDALTIVRIAEGMPGGVCGIFKQWGYLDFARAIEKAHGIHEEA